MSFNIDEFDLLLKRNELFLRKQYEFYKLLAKKQLESLLLLQERFYKFLNMKSETLDIFLLKPSTDSLVLQVNELLYDLEAD